MIINSTGTEFKQASYLLDSGIALRFKIFHIGNAAYVAKNC